MPGNSGYGSWQRRVSLNRRTAVSDKTIVESYEKENDVKAILETYSTSLGPDELYRQLGRAIAGESDLHKTAKLMAWAKAIECLVFRNKLPVADEKALKLMAYLVLRHLHMCRDKFYKRNIPGGVFSMFLNLCALVSGLDTIAAFISWGQATLTLLAMNLPKFKEGSFDSFDAFLDHAESILSLPVVQEELEKLLRKNGKSPDAGQSGGITLSI